MNPFKDDRPSRPADVALHRNGIIAERARRAGRSLTAVERNIILCGRDLARAQGFTPHLINALEMEGERNMDIVSEPLRVKVEFAYHAEFEGVSEGASYFITDSNHPALPLHGNVGADQLIEAGVKVPKTPTLEQWIKKGRPCFGGQKKKFPFSLLAATLVMAFLGSGCHSLDRLTGNEHHSASQGGSARQTGTLTILVAGQSNAEALAVTPADNTYSVTGNVSMVYHGASEVTPTQANPTSNSITWIKLGDLIASQSGRHVKIVNVAIGSTNSDQWANTYVHYITDAISQYHPDLIIWVQGENDTYASFPTAQTYANYKAILDQVGGTHFYCAIDGFMPGMDRQPVRNAQQQVIAEGRARQGVDVDALRNTPSNMEWTGIHFAGTGYMAHAQAWFNILESNGEVF